MKQVLEAKLSQHLTLTPQLQQAIRLLQLSAQDLAKEIHEGLENNPMLELTDEIDSAPESSHDKKSSSDDAVEAHPEFTQAETTPNEAEYSPDGETEYTSGSDTEYSAGFDDNLNSQYWSNVRNKQYKEDFDDYLSELKDTSDQSIKAHLMSQLELISLSDSDRLIAETLIDMIDEEGYCTDSLEDIQEILLPQIADVQLDEISAVLNRIQHFDPIGIGSRNLCEYLLLQLQQLPQATPFLDIATQLVAEDLDVIAEQDIKRLRQLTQHSEKDLFSALRLIKSLSPRPSSKISDTNPMYVIPDVVISKSNGAWMIELNSGVTPAIQINKYYASILNTQKNLAAASELKQQLQEARWLVKSLESRNDTLLRVSTCIMNKQEDFLEHGDVAMKPLILQDIAEQTGLHESTVSRITNQKFIQTPLGVYELKYFFSSHLSKENGQECSSTAIRALIKKIITNEPKAKPFSDNKIAQLLSAQQGINIARRTITKYREAMGIAASNLRKRAAQFEQEGCQ